MQNFDIGEKKKTYYKKALKNAVLWNGLLRMNLWRGTNNWFHFFPHQPPNKQFVCFYNIVRANILYQVIDNE